MVEHHWPQWQCTSKKLALKRQRHYQRKSSTTHCFCVHDLFPVGYFFDCLTYGLQSTLPAQDQDRAWVLVCNTWFSRQTTHDCCQPRSSWSCSTYRESAPRLHWERLSAMYAAQFRTPSAGRKWQLLTAALFLSQFSLVGLDQGVFGSYRDDLWGSSQCFGPPMTCQSSHDFLRPDLGAGQGPSCCGL